MRLSALIAALAIACAPLPLPSQARDSVILLPAGATVVDVILALEGRWNDAHVNGDTTTLKALWADDMTVTVPEMRTLTKPELLAFWRSGRSHITRHETSDVMVRGFDDSAIVDGKLIRERNFNGRVVTDRWRFTKVYVRRGGQWRVVSYHASLLPPAPTR
jgi:hypothetical protein